MKPGAVLSLQKHFHRAEHWIVVKGAAEATHGNEVVLMHENESIYLPIGTIHRMTNLGKIDLKLIEVQTGSYLGEDDFIRIEDVYNRRSPASALRRMGQHRQIPGRSPRGSEPRAESRPAIWLETRA